MGSRPTPSDMHGPTELLANLATQNDADEAGVPMTTRIDCIRAYSSNPNSVAVKQQTVSAPDGKDVSAPLRSTSERPVLARRQSRRQS